MNTLYLMMLILSMYVLSLEGQLALPQRSCSSLIFLKTIIISQELCMYKNFTKFYRSVISKAKVNCLKTAGIINQFRLFVYKPRFVVHVCDKNSEKLLFHPFKASQTWKLTYSSKVPVSAERNKLVFSNWKGMRVKV